MKEEDDYKEIISRLDKFGKEKAFGELIVDLIISNKKVSENIEGLTDSLMSASNQSTKINRWIMILTLFVAISAVINALYYVHLLVCN